MKVKKYLVLILCVLLVTTILNGETKFNHFKVYAARGEFKQMTVSLQDQFDRGPKKTMVTGIRYFANPVNKNGEGIPNRYAHLTWYTIKIDEPVIQRVVVIENQFGKQKWVLGRALFLLVPTEKIEPNSSFPKEFNHFKCYEVLKYEFKPCEVKLQDQFYEKPLPVVVKKPMYFCNPVSKNNEKIFNPKYHLACYYIDSPQEPTTPRTIKIKNQFGDNKLVVQKGPLLCVPSLKLEYSVLK
ncbi:MAG: hypothetical protein NT166_27985 [Candidatus Aminicenantes bacterium]|nr:hypothetical protein [Candidatus Aminicenantes bacterium]